MPATLPQQPPVRQSQQQPPPVGPLIGKGQDVTFASPNQEEGLTFEKAYGRLNSANHKAAKDLSQQLFQAAGLQADSHSAIGDWSDGAEDSFLHVIKNSPSPDAARYVAAWQGLMSNQKAVLHFTGDDQGKDSVYQIFLPLDSANEVRKVLSREGIQYRTIVPRNGGHVVVVFDEGGALRENVENLGNKFNASVREARGAGEFIGGATRTAARAEYRRIIRDFESKRTGTPQPGAGADRAGAGQGPGASPSGQGPRQIQRKARGPVLRFGAEDKRLLPHPKVMDRVQSYMRMAGLPYPEDGLDYQPVDVERAKRIADHYHKAPHAPNDPRVKAAYDAFKRETLRQYQHLVRSGVKFTPWTKDGQPYANSKEMRRDVLDNDHLYHFVGGDMGDDNHLSERTGIKVNGHDLTYNDAFRAVHDYFGHALYGNQFGPRGEEHAWRTHSRMYSPAARPAMSFETRGQNSWVNFGPHSHLPVTQRPYAEQKNNVLPADLSTETGASQPKAIFQLRRNGPLLKFAQKGTDSYSLAQVQQIQAQRPSPRKAPPGGMVSRGLFYEGGKIIPKAPPAAASPQLPAGPIPVNGPTGSTEPSTYPQGQEGKLPNLVEQRPAWHDELDAEIEGRETTIQEGRKTSLEDAMKVLDATKAKRAEEQQGMLEGFDPTPPTKKQNLLSEHRRHFNNVQDLFVAHQDQHDLILPKQKKLHLATARKVWNNMSPEALKHIGSKVHYYRFHPDLRTLTAAIRKSDPLIEEFLPEGTIIGGAFDRHNALWLDGEYDLKDQEPGETSTINDIYSHEFTHGVDGTAHEFSQDHKFQKAWIAEVYGPAHYLDQITLSKYAATSPTEGMAEFGRLLYSGTADLRMVQTVFPRLSEFFKKAGLWPRNK